MTQAAMQAINALPPGMRMVFVILSVVITGGGGGFGIFTHIDAEFSRLIAKIDNQTSIIRGYESRFQDYDWQFTLADNRITGQASKNRDQDMVHREMATRIRDNELQIARRDPIYNRRNP